MYFQNIWIQNITSVISHSTAEQQPTTSLSYCNQKSQYVITKISNASHIVVNLWTLWIGGAQQQM